MNSTDDSFEDNAKATTGDYNYNRVFRCQATIADDNDRATTSIVVGSPWGKEVKVVKKCWIRGGGCLPGRD